MGERIVSIKSILSDREMCLLRMIYSEHRTQGEVAVELGLTQGRVSQLQREIFDRIRNEQNIMARKAAKEMRKAGKLDGLFREHP